MTAELWAALIPAAVSLLAAAAAWLHADAAHRQLEVQSLHPKHVTTSTARCSETHSAGEKE